MRQFTVGLAPETLRRSNLGSLIQGSKVNLERALKADGRNSGIPFPRHLLLSSFFFFLLPLPMYFSCKLLCYVFSDECTSTSVTRRQMFLKMKVRCLAIYDTAFSSI